jgi:quercetin dioxygenase-like cupin family protein
MDITKPIRRILTGIDDTGRSRIIEDGTSPSVRTVAERPGYRVTNLWATDAAPADINGPDIVAGLSGVLPPKNGSVIRIIDIPPEPKDPAERERAMKASFGKLFADAQHAPEPGQHPGMHTTDTVDYAILLAGELVAIMDEEEVTMQAGDVLIQRGTNHGWSNRSSEPARIAFILLDGQSQRNN